MNVVVLAAGMGKRMRSELPKVLHELAGKPLLAHVLDGARSLNPSRIVVVYGHGGDKVRQALDAPELRWALQSPQLGTGHAVQQAVEHLVDDGPTLVLAGDVPLLRPASLKRLLQAAGDDKLGILTVEPPDATGYGRIVRENGQIVRIVEHKDADDATRAIREINSGVIVAPTARLKGWLKRLSNDNAQGEYYLTDIVGLAVADGVPVVSAQPDAWWETEGINSKPQLAALERIAQRNIAEQLMNDGVTLADPARIDVRGTLSVGRDVTIDVNCVFEGEVVLEDGVSIAANCVIRDARIGAGTEIKPFCHIDSSTIGAGGEIGPYARLRPGCAFEDHVRIGNFVELKNAKLASGAKAPHLSYVGDAVVGERVNIGAGTITCNYDGANKHQTVIEADAFIGSDCQLVAPVRVGRGATLGAGTTLTRDAPADKLTISRARQTTIENWQRPTKKPKAG